MVTTENNHSFNPRKNFEYDLEFGEFYEKKLLDILTNKKLEIKTERGINNKANKWNVTGNLFIEISYKGKPSGIRKTKSEYWMQLLEFEGGLYGSVMLPTQTLYNMVREHYQTKKWKTVMGGDDNQSEGVLVPLSEVFKANNDFPMKFMDNNKENNNGV